MSAGFTSFLHKLLGWVAGHTPGTGGPYRVAVGQTSSSGAVKGEIHG